MALRNRSLIVRAYKLTEDTINALWILKNHTLRLLSVSESVIQFVSRPEASYLYHQAATAALEHVSGPIPPMFPLDIVFNLRAVTCPSKVRWSSFAKRNKPGETGSRGLLESSLPSELKVSTAVLSEEVFNFLTPAPSTRGEPTRPKLLDLPRELDDAQLVGTPPVDIPPDGATENT